MFAATALLATLDALRLQARELVRDFGAGAFAAVRPSRAEAGRAGWDRESVERLRANLEGAAWVSGVKALPPPAGADHAVVAADAELARARGWRFIEGRALDEMDVRQGARSAMAPDALCRRLGWAVGDVLLLGNEPFRLVGRFEAVGMPLASLPEQAVFVPHAAAAADLDGEDAARRVDALLFRTRDGHAPEQVRRRAAALLGHPDAGAAGVEWITPDMLLEGIRRWQRAIAWTAGSGGGLALLLGAATLAGMLLTGARERIPEIGLRRALGARRGEIAALFVAEALALACAAALAGMGAAELSLRWLGGRFPLPFHFGWGARVAPPALAAAIALLCSAGPAWFAARLPPAEALRNE